MLPLRTALTVASTPGRPECRAAPRQAVEYGDHSANGGDRQHTNHPANRGRLCCDGGHDRKWDKLERDLPETTTCALIRHRHRLITTPSTKTRSQGIWGFNSQPAPSTLEEIQDDVKLSNPERLPPTAVIVHHGADK